jgi:hypothetical protein
MCVNVGPKEGELERWDEINLTTYFGGKNSLGPNYYAL